MNKTVYRMIGVIGATGCVAIFVWRPSFPTPDKLLIFLTFVFMAYGRAGELLKRLVPFVGLLLVYESFRGLAAQLNTHVQYAWMIHADRALFGGTLPTITLQRWLWNGHVQWYDFVFYLAYMMHFVLPIALALLIWKYRDEFYWQFVATFVAVSFAGFLTFLSFPAAPPWLAVDKGYIHEPLTRVSGHIWQALGITNFPSIYDKISPNPVAAVPSLHAAYATLLVIFVYKLFGKRWALLASIYPLIIYVGTVYSGEHYAIDEIAGIIYAVAAYTFMWFAFREKQLHKRTVHYLRRRVERWQTSTEGEY